MIQSLLPKNSLEIYYEKFKIVGAFAAYAKYKVNGCLEVFPKMRFLTVRTSASRFIVEIPTAENTNFSAKILSTAIETIFCVGYSSDYTLQFS